jgi:hypothetical protein
VISAPTPLQLTRQTFVVASNEQVTEVRDCLCKVLLQDYL